MIYLASPYSHPDQAVREQRFQEVCKVAADMMQHGEQVFSPIAHSHPIAEFGLPKDWEFWEAFGRWFIERCVKLSVLVLPGWQDSKGVRVEMGIALKCGIPIDYVHPLPPVTGEGRT